MQASVESVVHRDLAVRRVELHPPGAPARHYVVTCAVRHLDARAMYGTARPHESFAHDSLWRADRCTAKSLLLKAALIPRRGVK